VLLAFIGDISDRQALVFQCRNHHFGLVRRHNLIFQSLEEDHRARQALYRMDRRALPVEIGPLGIGTDKLI
jgi:hypothetical protein